MAVSSDLSTWFRTSITLGSPFTFASPILKMLDYDAPLRQEVRAPAERQILLYGRERQSDSERCAAWGQVKDYIFSELPAAEAASASDAAVTALCARSSRRWCRE